MVRQDQYFKALLSHTGIKWNDHMSHRDEKWDGQEKQRTEWRVRNGRKQSVSYWEEYFRGVNGAELHSSSTLNLLLCLTLCMQRMKLWRQRRQQVGESMRQDSWQNNIKLNAGTMHSHVAARAVFALEDKKVNEPNNRQNRLPCQSYNHRSLTESRI